MPLVDGGLYLCIPARYCHKIVVFQVNMLSGQHRELSQYSGEYLAVLYMHHTVNIYQRAFDLCEHIKSKHGSILLNFAQSKMFFSPGDTQQRHLHWNAWSGTDTSSIPARLGRYI